MKRKANMKEAGEWIGKAISELEPLRHVSCPNELGMRFTIAMIRINNAFEAAGLWPIEMAIPMLAQSETEPCVFRVAGATLLAVNANHSGEPVPRSGVVALSIERYRELAGPPEVPEMEASVIAAMTGGS